MTKKTPEVEAEAATETVVKSDKSIINPKYRDRKEPDWLAATIAAHTSSVKEVVTRTKDDDGNVSESTALKPDGIDVDKLFHLAEINGADVSKFQEQRERPGFPGRFRMTVRNILQASVKKRHGLHLPHGDGTHFVSAPVEFLKVKGAPAHPTHLPDGTKIVVDKPAKEAVAEAAE